MRISGDLIRILAFATSIIAASPLAVRAQTLNDVVPGHRVRLVIVDSLRQTSLSASRQPVVGEFVRITADSVWMRLRGTSDFSIARDHIKSASLSRGSSRAFSAVTMGVTLGALSMLAVDRSRTRPDLWTAASIGFGGGVIIGAVRPFERWHHIRK